MTTDDATEIVPAALLHEHNGRQIHDGGRWLHLIWADAENNGDLLRIRTVEQGRGYLQRDHDYEVRGEPQNITFLWALGERESMNYRLDEMDRHIASGDLEYAVAELEALAVHARRTAVKLRQQLDLRADRWDNEPADDQAQPGTGEPR